MKQIASTALILIGVFIIASTRVKSVDLTEGQAFIQYWDHWLTGVICMLLAIFINKKGI